MEKWINKIVCGDNLEIARKIGDNTLDFIYIDPPFFTQSVQKSKSDPELEYSDKYENINEYIKYWTERAFEFYRTLKHSGSIFVHCDYRTNMHWRLILDYIFGSKCLVNEIAWCYGGIGKKKTRSFGKRHDTIFFYGKTENYKFNYNEVQKLVSESTIRRVEKKHKFFNSTWLRNSDGAYCREDWITIPYVTGTSKERTAYPTQKPEALLEILVKVSTNKGDIGADFTGGSGTTAAVLRNKHRSYFHVDQNMEACKIAAKRLSYPFNKIINLKK